MCVEESIKCHTLIPAYGVQTTKPVGSHKLTNRFRCHAVKTAWHQAFPGFPYPDFNGFEHGCQRRLRGVQRDLNPSFPVFWRNNRMQLPFVRGSPSQKGAFLMKKFHKV